MIFDIIQLNNCTVTPNLDTITDTDNVTITLTANQGYAFVDTPYIEIWGVGQEILYFTIINNGLNAVLNVDFSDYVVRSVDIYATAEPSTSYNDYGLINVYKVNFSQLNQFALTRFFTKTESVQSETFISDVDLGNYIISLKKFYNDLGNTLPNVIHAANYDTQIATETPLNDIIILNCGTITIPQKNNNITDFNTNIQMFLPFVGLIELDSNLVGKTLKLLYEINIISGNGTAKIFCVENNTDFLINEINCLPYDEVIFKPPTNAYNNTTLNFRSSLGLEPYIIIKYFNSSNTLPQSDNRRGVIENLNLTGLCRFKDIIIDWSSETSSNMIGKHFEEEEIKRLLSNGIIL